VNAELDSLLALDASTSSPSMTTPIIPSCTSSPMRRSTVSGQPALALYDCEAVEGCELRRCLAFMVVYPSLGSRSHICVAVSCYSNTENYRPRSAGRPVPETGHGF